MKDLAHLGCLFLVEDQVSPQGLVAYLEQIVAIEKVGMLAEEWILYLTGILIDISLLSLLKSLAAGAGVYSAASR